MSILNAIVTLDTAIVGVDTETISADCRTVGRFSKMVPLVHANTIFAGRGTAVFLSAVLSSLHLTGGEDFDGLVARLPAAAEEAYKMLLIVASRLGQRDTTSLGGQTAVLVGYSAKRGRMVCFECEQEAHGQGFKCSDDHGYHIAPWAASLDRLPQPATMELMIHYARAQIRLMKEKAPQLVTGGQLIVAKMTREAMWIGPVYDLGSCKAHHGCA